MSRNDKRAAGGAAVNYETCRIPQRLVERQDELAFRRSALINVRLTIAHRSCVAFDSNH